MMKFCHLGDREHGCNTIYYCNVSTARLYYFWITQKARTPLVGAIQFYGMEVQAISQFYGFTQIENRGKALAKILYPI